MKTNIDYSLYLATDSGISNKQLEHAVELAIQGGVTIVQIREKYSDSLEFYNLALKIKPICAKYSVPLIVNDRIDIALAIDADGVHIGQNDLPANIARKLIGKNKILGVSVFDLETSLKAKNDGADYLGIGSIFPTNTKKDAYNVNIKDLLIIKERVDLPIVAIGGINNTNINQLKNSGISGIAVISAILGAEDIKSATIDLKSKFNLIK